MKAANDAWVRPLVTMISSAVTSIAFLVRSLLAIAARSSGIPCRSE